MSNNKASAKLLAREMFTKTSMLPSDIAERFGVSVKTVKTWIKEEHWEDYTERAVGQNV
jgi:uncharacterized protein YjcR